MHRRARLRSNTQFALESLEPRRLLAVTPVDPGDAIPFTKLVLDPNTGRRALEKNIADIDGDGRADAVVGFSTGGGNVGGIFWYAYPTNGVASGAWTKYTIVGSGDGYEDLIIHDVNND